ncbi:MAG: FAD-dependent oxidoreductase [Limnochordales bacterium]|nr:FAD-dependent oxidoreductase [Limnochordales bacterium]
MYDVAVIGAGAAGTSAAIFTARAGLRTLLVDAGESGLVKAALYNHLGYERVSGPEFLQLAKEQARAAGAEFVEARVTGLELSSSGDRVYSLKAENGQEFLARHVILCTGKSLDLARQAGLELTAGRERKYPEIIKVDSDGRTSLTGVWAAGAVAGASPHTIIVAGDGARVAINLLSELQGKRVVDHDVLPVQTPAATA